MERMMEAMQLKTPLEIKFDNAKYRLLSKGYKISAGSWIDEEIGRYYVCSVETCPETFGHPLLEISGNEQSEWETK